MRSLIVLGGADGAITTLQAARRMGLHTICVDQRTDAPALRFADEYSNVSTRDIERLIAAFADRADVIGVVSPASDVNLPSQFALAEALELPCGLSADAVRASVDKGFFRTVCDRLGQPGPGFAQGRPSDLGAVDLAFPVMVKPTDSSGGRGISICHRPDDVGPAMTHAGEFSASGVVILEEYLIGSHHTAEAIVVDGRVELLAVGDRVLTPPPHFVTVENRMPTSVVGLNEQVRTMLDAVCHELGYRFGSLNADILVTPADRVVLIEIGARIGGNGSAELLGLVHGLDAIEASISLTIGERPVLRSAAAAHAAFRVVTSRRSGKLIAFHGADRVRSRPEVIDLVLAAQPGDHVEPYHRAGAKLGYVMVAAATSEQLRQAIDDVDELLDIEVADE